MNFQEQYKTKTKKQIWEEYCGFLDLSIDEFMEIQNRLMNEQLTIWKNSAIGKSLLINNNNLNTISEFRKNFKLTNYQDYADILLTKNDDMLPAKAVIWIMTTWEGGIHPIKLAPYSANMIESFKDNVFACMILASSTAKYQYNVVPNSTFLYGLAPLPYATGLLPRALSMNIDIKFLPNVEEAEKMTFKERNKLGFKLGLKEGIDYFFGLGSVAYYISNGFASLTESKNNSSSKTSVSKKIAYRYIKSKYACKKDNRKLLPKDIFKLKGFMVTGTDMDCYKDELEKMWGIKPLEVFAGTEPTCIGCEDYNRNGMYFFPDACFYEFIKEEDMLKCIDDESYNPKTYLFNEVEVNQIYELVISVLKGGAFMRYRVKDLYRCLGKNEKGLPRFKYLDRALDIIDIAGFTRISKQLIDNVIQLSKLPIKNYVATKEYSDSNKPFLHMYVEIDEKSLIDQAILSQILRDHLSIYFKYLDTDYQDLKKILGIDPLTITILRCGIFNRYLKTYNKPIRSFNPNKLDIVDLLNLQQEDASFDDFNEVSYE